uniref:Ninjurin a n=1 Tax=Anopheles funestus TaxID=62324 RepID=A0A4Y0BKR4_ANOFN
MPSTEDSTALINNIETNASDVPNASQTNPSQLLSSGSPPNGRGSTTNYGSVNAAGVTHNQPSSIPAYRPGVNPDGTHVIHINDDGHIIPNINVYQQKKSLAQGMMDLALLSANANQLRYVLESCQNHPFFYVNLVFVSTSIFVQVVVGFGLIWKSQYNMNNPDDYRAATRINNLVSIGIFIITLVNVMLSAFSIAEISEKK